MKLQCDLSDTGYVAEMKRLEKRVRELTSLFEFMTEHVKEVQEVGGKNGMGKSSMNALISGSKGGTHAGWNAKGTVELEDTIASLTERVRSLLQRNAFLEQSNESSKRLGIARKENSKLKKMLATLKEENDQLKLKAEELERQVAEAGQTTRAMERVKRQHRMVVEENERLVQINGKGVTQFDEMKREKEALQQELEEVKKGLAMQIGRGRLDQR